MQSALNTKLLNWSTYPMSTRLRAGTRPATQWW